MKQDRIAKEKSFHDQRFGGDDGIRKKADKYYSVNTHVVNRYIELVFKFSKNKKLMEYGCGTGNESEKWVKNGALLTGIDISSEGIKKAKELATQHKFDAEFFVMNAEKTEFPDNSFDVIAGTGILHHLNLDDTYKELSRILRGGRTLFSLSL